jgi:hypothetical protein
MTTWLITVKPSYVEVLEYLSTGPWINILLEDRNRFKVIPWEVDLK